jgi:hypothetical protein
MNKIVCIIAILCVFCPFTSAHGFDYDQYKRGDMDSLMQLPKAAEGVRVVAPQKIRFQVTLSGYGKTCDTGFLKKAMIMVGAPKDVVERTKISKCITVKTAKGASVSLFIQDQVAEYLPSEIKLGEKIEIFCDYLYIGKTGPGILVSEFQKIE